MHFTSLVPSIQQTHTTLQQQAVSAVNRSLTIRNWLIGYYIVEFEQKGEDRAEYGNRLLELIAPDIKKLVLKGLQVLNSQDAVNFILLIRRFLGQCPKNHFLNSQTFLGQCLKN